MNHQQSIYLSFNARNLKPEEVAKTFVAHDSFFRLIETNHSLLMGPRGSGKTTMLKMLTSRALRSWQHPRASELIANLKFVAIYIPTDVHWSNQLRYTDEQIGNCRVLAQRVSEAAVTTNVLYALSQTFADRIRYELNDTASASESELCEALISAWKLQPCLPRLQVVQFLLRSRISDIVSTASRLLTYDDPDGQVKMLPDWFFLDYLEAVSVACKAFDIYIPVDNQKWALCFDELELAPAWLSQRLMGEIRSTNEDILYKLSTSPIPNFLGYTQASPRQDFSQIYLWSHTRQDSREFSEEIVTTILERNGVEHADLRQIFGTSVMSQSGADEYGEGTVIWKMTRELAHADPSLQSLLLRHGISPDNPTTSDPAKKNQVLRKIKPIVLLRHEFGKSNIHGERVGRSRKRSLAYQGIETICDISDGNPRWLIGIISDLLATSRRTSTGQIAISEEDQARVLLQASRQFRALIFTIPDKSRESSGYHYTLFNLLLRIRRYFYKRIILDEFPLDPVGSFVADEDSSDDIIELLRLATYYGAIVYVDPTEHPFSSDLVGKRFRFSFILSPVWKLPVRLYDSVKLSTCLQGTAPKQGQLPF